MFYFPARMVLSHIVFLLRSLSAWLIGGGDWWTTPVMVPTKKRVWCIWRLGFWWTTIRYGDIKKTVFSQWRNSGPRFTVVCGEDKAVVLSLCYSFRELSKIKDAVLYNWCAATGKRLRRQELGRESVIWTLGEDGESDAADGFQADIVEGGRLAPPTGADRATGRRGSGWRGASGRGRRIGAVGRVCRS